MRRGTALLAAAFVIALGLGLTGCSVPEARGFDITHVDVEAELNADGSMDVVERATYDFTGEFSVGTRSFESAPYPYEITGIAAFEDGEELGVVTDTPELFEWDLDPSPQPVTTGEHTYELRYTVEGAAQVHPDVGELYWNWIGTTSPGTDRLDVDLTVPGNGRGVRAWAHGPLNGSIDRVRDHILLEVDDVPPGQFVDSRVLIPAAGFTVEPTGEPVEDQIVAEETRLAELANEQRAQAAEQADIDRSARIGFNVLTPFVIAAGWLAFFLVWRKWGKEPPAAPDIGDYWREVPDDPPAVAVALVSWGTVSPTAFAATVVDLAQRGFLTITESPDEGGLLGHKAEYTFDWQGQDSKDLLPFEKDLLGTLFQTGKSVTQSEFTAWARANQTESAKFWTRFQAKVGGELKHRNYLSRNGAVPYVIHILVLLAVFGWGFLAAFGADAVLLGGACMASAVGMACVTPLLRQRTEAGGRRFAEWNGLKRFLADFSRLDEAVAGDMVIYERYLVASVALGVADQLIAGLEVKMPAIVEQQSFAPWYVGSQVGSMGGGLGAMSSLGAFASNFGSKATSSFTPPSTSSSSGFSGGGFSSGGGGGGGGGGFGAR